MKLAAYFRNIFFISIVVACLTKADDNNREFSYYEESEFGPSKWGEIRPEWQECKAGKMQSPIDLVDHTLQIVSASPTLHTNYNPSNATLKNRGHHIMVRWAGGGGHMEIDGTQYHLNQLHWHSPSEHAINHKRYDMEVHLVHKSADNRTAVIGFLFEIGDADSFLSAIWSDLETVAATRDVEKTVGIIDPKLAISGVEDYYRYTGSLTTPPCTENIIWTVVRKVRTASEEQVQLIRAAIHDDSGMNARPLQEIHCRTVKLYRPSDRDD